MVACHGGSPELTGEQPVRCSWPQPTTLVAPGASGGEGEHSRGHGAGMGSHLDEGDGGEI